MRKRPLSEVDDVFVVCRAWAHQWEPEITYSEVRNGRRVLRQVLVCRREADADVEHPTTKEIEMYARGKHQGEYATTPTYDYAEGYAAEGVGRGKARVVARAEVAQRYIGAQR